MEIDYSDERVLDWIECGRLDVAGQELKGPLAYLRRPFSLAGRRDTRDGVELEFIHRVVGTGTAWLGDLKIGDSVDVLGPLGNRFPMPGDGELAVLVGGGVGIPPMLYLAESLASRNALAFCGAVSRDLLPLTINPDVPAPGPDSFEPLMNIAEFSRHGIPAVISTDDGTFGFRGYVTQALERSLDSVLSPRLRVPASPRPLIYTCGPEPMMKRVAQIASDRGLECQVAVERAMACGMGTCQSCCIRVRKPDPAKPPLPGSDWCWRLACTDGPISRGADLLW
jgi:dihydroorotate dehydrogenase electron transfer subunit